MTRVVAPSRLHFGLLHVPTDSSAPGRRFGGCGLMIDAPGVAVRVTPAAGWHGEGPSGRRAVSFARMVTTVPHLVVVERCPPEHVGLGVGTALGLAVAKALRPELRAAELAPMVGRGLRSGVGLHGFDLGGFVVDAGKADDADVPRLASRHAFPTDWRVALFVPDRPAVWHGPAERAAFARRRDPGLATRTADAMDGLLRREIVPAIDAGQFDRFCGAVHEYNRLAGVAFADEQGGTYAADAVAELVAAVRNLGYAGVGQSSWGPTVFAITADADQAKRLVDVIRGRFAGLRTADVVAAASGARVESVPNAPR